MLCVFCWRILKASVMEEASTFLSTRRYAVVTGANRGMGIEICRQLACKGVVVVLTARNEKKGTEALEKLIKIYGLREYVFFHQLDVFELSSLISLVDFIKENFRKLDILVNNAAITGVTVDSDAVRASASTGKIEWDKTIQTCNMGKECLETNYYGTKRTTQALIPLLELSDSPRVVHVASLSGKLKFIPNEWAREVFGNDESLTEENVDDVLNKFMKDFEDFELESNCWPTYLSAYRLSKAAINAYTKILAKKHTNILVNSVCPGFVKTDMNCNTGISSVEQGAENIVALALLPKDGPSGLFFSQKEVSPM